MARRDLTDIVAEKALLGCLLRSDHEYWRVADSVGPESFSLSIHREIYAAIADLLMGGKRLNHTVLVTRLPEEADDIDVSSYLATLAANAADLSALDFVERVADLASRRRLISISQTLAKAAHESDKPAIDIAAECEAAVLDVMQASAPQRPRRIDELARRVLTSSAEAQGGGGLPGFDTGLPSVDEIMGLMMPGDLIAVLGAQSDGKSSLITQFGMRAALTAPVLMFQLEMTGEQIAAREIAGRAGMTVREIREGAYSFDGLERLRAAEKSVTGPEFWILDQPKLTPRQMRAHALAMKRTRGLGMLIGDHLRLMRSDSRTKDRWDRQEDVTGELKSIAKELGVPFVLAAQRTRTAQRRDDPTPQVMDADAPSLDQDCDSIIAVWREENFLRRNKPNRSAGGEEWDKYYARIRQCKSVAKVIGLKVRSGEAHEERELRWIGSQTRFEEL